MSFAPRSMTPKHSPTSARRTDVITYEFENVPVDALRDLGDSIGIFPPPDALEQAQDRLKEKHLFQSLDIPLPAFRPVDSVDDLERAASEIGLPLVLKTRRFGYDGKGQFVLRSIDDCAEAVEELGGHGLIAEAWVPFDFEVSVIGVRSQSGEIAVWPLTENQHDNGILAISRAPLLDSGLEAQAGEFVSRMLERLDYVGVLALELFVADGRLLANEFAPRVHNSGHWTIEGAETSQFANHILAVVGEGPRSTEAVGHAGMLNLIGEIPAAARQLDVANAHCTITTSRPDRVENSATSPLSPTARPNGTKSLRELCDAVRVAGGTCDVADPPRKRLNWSVERRRIFC